MEAKIENKIIDYICYSHRIPKSYSKYCSTCKVDICDWCKGHDGHYIIDYSSMDQNPEDFKRKEKKLNEIDSEIKTFFQEQLKFYQNEKEEILKKLKTIDNIIADINKTMNKLDAKIYYNKCIVSAYKDKKINYHILDTLLNLNFDFDTKFYKKKWDNFGISHELPLNLETNEKFKNMWISEKYCKHWGLNEAIREFLQNQFDAVISKVKTKDNLYVDKKKEKYDINNIKVFLNFDLTNKKNKKRYGKIRYDSENNVLQFSNKGSLCLGDFLLGGVKDEKDNNDLIGTFGEGMKLAILALCRLNKEVIIYSSNIKYTFKIIEDKLFYKDGQPQRCLHFKQEETNEKVSNNIRISINNINVNEWGSQIINFLWLLDDDSQIYTSYDENKKELGQILNEDYLKGKIYVKGIFVENIKYESNQNKADCLGFNVDIALNRDRNYIPSREDLKDLISDITSSFCNNNAESLIQIQKEREENEGKNNTLTTVKT